MRRMYNDCSACRVGPDGGDGARRRPWPSPVAHPVSHQCGGMTSTQPDRTEGGRAPPCQAGVRRSLSPTGVPMSSTAEPGHLNNPHHRQTLLQTFQHPASHNIEWHAMLSLLDAVGSVELRHDGEYAVHIAAETAFLGPRQGKDLDVDQVLVVRRLLTAAGYGPVVEAMQAKGKKV